MIPWRRAGRCGAKCGFRTSQRASDLVGAVLVVLSGTPGFRLEACSFYFNSESGRLVMSGHPIFFEKGCGRRDSSEVKAFWSAPAGADHGVDLSDG